MEAFKLETNTCFCPPETCRCKDYKITLDGDEVCTGNNYLTMEILVLQARVGHLTMKEGKKGK